MVEIVEIGRRTQRLSLLLLDIATRDKDNKDKETVHLLTTSNLVWPWEKYLKMALVDVFNPFDLSQSISSWGKKGNTGKD